MVYRIVRQLVLVSFLAALLAGCGGARSTILGDGSWYGKVVSVDVARRTMMFTPACRLSAGRWIAVPASNRVPKTVALARSADLEIYFRPGGDLAAGHGQ